jgi:hypothetical protein
MKITYRDYPEFEAVAKIWNKFDTVIYIEFDEELDATKEEQKKYFQKIEEKIQWIESHKDLILDTFIEEEGMFDGLNDMIREKIAKNGIAKFYDDLVFEKEVSEGEFKNAIEVLSIDFYIDGEELTCTFDLTANPDYFFGHIATIEIDEDNQIEMGGING